MKAVRVGVVVLFVVSACLSVVLLLPADPATAWDWIGAVDQGFNDVRNNEAMEMAVYGGRLYLGTQNAIAGCEVWSTDGTGWRQEVGQDPDGTPGTGPGFGDAVNSYVISMSVYKKQLYVGTGGAKSEVWRYDGHGWEEVMGQDAPGTPGTGPGFGDFNNSDATSMATLGDRLYVGTENWSSGCEVWSWDGASWRQEVGQGAPDTPTGGGFGRSFNNGVALSMAVYGSDLYVGTQRSGGCDIWRTDGNAWTQVVGQDAPGTIGTGPGFGDFNNRDAASMAVYGDRLYVGTGINGCQVWRMEGVGWTQIVGQGGAGSPTAPGFGEASNFSAISMLVYDSNLYVGTDNINGCELWAYNGDDWLKRVGEGLAGTEGPGFGNPANDIARSLGEFNSLIYTGTYNDNGCEVWNNKFSTTWYLAEGATIGGFDTYILVQNPSDQPVEVDIKYQTGEGEKQGPHDTIPASSRRTYMVDSDPNVQTYDVSTRVTASGDVVCERAMYWKPEGAASYVLGHDSIGVTNPSPTWYLAEGATAGGYETWVLVQNPSERAVSVDIKYQTDKGESQGPRESIPGKSRKSFLVNETVTTFDVSTKVTAGAPVICERAVYWTPPGSTGKEVGTDSIGITVPGSTWYLAEGASLGGYETWVLVQNPNGHAVDVDIVYQTGEGDRQGPQETILPRSRRSFRVNDTVQTYDVSTLVTADGEVICERAMYWKPEGTANHVLGHDSIGVTIPAHNWFLPEGATDGGFDTWILVQNPNQDPVDVNIVYQTATQEVQGPQLSIPGESRKSFLVNESVTTLDVSARVWASGPVICERAVYWTPLGSAWKVLGTDSIGFSAPLIP